MIPLFPNKEMWFLFVKELISWLGTPFAHYQKEKGKGADCGLFLAACLEKLNIIDNMQFKYYPRFWHKFTNEEIILNFINNVKSDYYKLVNIKTQNLIRGDILTFSLRSRLTNHISMYFGNKMIIHAVNKKGVCIVPLNSTYKNRITNIYRIFKCQKQQS